MILGVCWMNNVLLLPARLNSKRLPNKLLIEVGGKSILESTYQRCTESGYDTFVVTGSREIIEHCAKRNIKHIPVYEQTLNGSDLVIRCLRLLETYDNFINVQADCPNITVKTIQDVVKYVEKHQHCVTTAHYTSNSWEKLGPNDVKLVTNDRSKVLYFSRENIPHAGQTFKVHVGIYGFPRKIAKYINSLGLDNPFESESLEQLNWLYHDLPIHSIDGQKCNSINCLEDLKNYEAIINGEQCQDRGCCGEGN